ncbi:M48 family metallopeptidase [Nitratireductor sp. XY-223]|uniref:M48 family metallopeptidase n=1 Tax=Nitratireductor sp. XY-223 TaxID=2561926 RepID=UPI0010AB1A79|nr:M48 family metallopeptidase [Nitratireductor sp. XY-223]
MFGLKKRSGTSRKRPQRSRDIAVAGRRLPLTIREHERATRLTLRIEPGGRALKLSVPVGIEDREIDRFLHRHHGWLQSRLAKLPKASGVEEGSSIPIRGVAHRIARTGKFRGITETGEMDGEPVLRVGGAPEHLGRRIVDFLKKQARADLETAVARHTAALGQSAAGISLKDTKSRWGSCSSRGNLSFSWRIVMAPDYVIDYLAAHEVAHLKEMNHGPRFWALCRQLCARTDEAKRWLKRHGSALHAIEFKP